MTHINAIASDIASIISTYVISIRSNIRIGGSLAQYALLEESIGANRSHLVKHL